MPESTDKSWWQARREELDLSVTQMAARFDVTAGTVVNWETDLSMPRPSIPSLAVGYEVAEDVIEREIISLRRRMERRRESLAAAG